ncbi:MAG: gamma-glutamylcyclotransferase [Hyphomicrobiaceae bacterium]|nr:gamma-glutamylcyclotransferase [Hyphomicrobiaceae bacterium]
MNSLLFVYGTLMSRARHTMGVRLRREARLLGAATINGRLYSLHRYPGLVEGLDGRYAVRGEVYDLNAPAASLKWLDAYEGILSGRSEDSPYERVQRPVQLASGEVLTAWVYLYRKSVRTRPQVLGGTWLPRQFSASVPGQPAWLSPPAASESARKSAAT